MNLSLQKIVKTYDGKAVLNHFSACFQAGGCYLLLGENGAGKSTLVKCIAGDVPYDSGTMHYPQPLADCVAIQYQSFDSYSHLKISEVIRLFQALTEEPRDLTELYHLLELATYNHVLVKNASGGQRKALSIYLAFLLNKPIILLDEPFADLDLMKKKQLASFLKKDIEQTQRIIVIISHEVAGFESLFNEIYILKEGQLADCGTLEALEEKYSNPVFKGIEGIYFEVTGKVLGGQVG
ncbi:ABC transporter ATP-binding protein [Metasolibacillus sp.]|uniref:ATP-binding cassette domain-containing protein n=1 Tax=Metasolibacillus sp. TaxID=2703680 RepID=UPI0025EE8CF1|nr:ABC transporter ATP-binding protein [Metasolibacillus sp.]MCT6923212.1 ABC transporter ATP-binding protein [Metasolibacillus sp.]MCT6939483.1 ABC transporter ATP-binding protein [Metasolibacillus sp.]